MKKAKKFSVNEKNFVFLKERAQKQKNPLFSGVKMRRTQKMEKGLKKSFLLRGQKQSKT
ncbi:MAG: hypothetical protein IKM53_03780 [Clostridia bacterium]|nr:hypothetical protein [Clostridia bacterium]